jgi:hypothetical protein
MNPYPQTSSVAATVIATHISTALGITADHPKLHAPAAVEKREDCSMRPASPNNAMDVWDGLSRSGCEELLRHAIDCLAIDGAAKLSPRDRARLASAAAILREIREDLERSADRQADSRKSETRTGA